MDWQAIGTAVAGLVLGAGGVAAWVHKQQVANASAGAETNVIELLRGEVRRLSERLTAMEGREGRLIRHVYRLEGLMRAKDIEPPPFDIDVDSYRAGGTA